MPSGGPRSVMNPLRNPRRRQASLHNEKAVPFLRGGHFFSTASPDSGQNLREQGLIARTPSRERGAATPSKDPSKPSRTSLCRIGGRPKECTDRLATLRPRGCEEALLENRAMALHGPRGRGLRGFKPAAPLKLVKPSGANFRVIR